jgi:chaperonin GroES
MELETTLELRKIVRSPNLVEELSENDVANIGNLVVEDWLNDKNSRSDWETKTADAMKLAMQVVEEKTFPWENASNVKFPIVTIAALQFQSRAYPALIPSTQVVKCRVFGEDKDGLKQARAERVGEYMSFQVLEEDDCWEKNMDEVLISQAIVGCAFKKSYFDPSLGHNVSEHVLAKDLYIPYFAKSLEKASRITQMLYLSQNDLVHRARTGLYVDLKTETDAIVDTSSPLEVVSQESQGLIPSLQDPSTPREVLEQHRYLDLDGDGYSEPYICTVDVNTRQVLRIVARFNSAGVKKNRTGLVVSIEPIHYFTKFTFIPSPDGGIYDLGFGVLLGPLNESINTLLNQLVDAGTLANTAGGFLGRGVKFRSGDNNFKPFEWKRVDSTGDDVRKGVFPLPVREPSTVLFQLLGLLIDYGERIGMATDPLVGVNPGQNTPAETSRSMVNEGQRIFGAVFKRTYRSLKEEFKKLFALNAIYLNDTTLFNSINSLEVKQVLRNDFIGTDMIVVPAADPNMVSKEQKLMQAMTVKQNAMAAPGMYNSYLVEKNLLEALGVENIDSILPDPTGPNAIPQQPDSKVVIETMKIEQKNMQFKMEMQLKMFDLMQEIEYLRAEIAEKESRAILNLAMAKGQEDNMEIVALQTAISIAKTKQEGLIQTLSVLKDLAGFAKEKKGLVDGISGGLAGMEETPRDSGMVQTTPKSQGGDSRGLGE